MGAERGIGPPLDDESVGMKHKEMSEAALRELVEAFYAKVQIDPRIGPVFNDAIEDWPEHLEKLQAFWSSIVLRTGRYQGRPMPAHIKHAGSITAASFERWLHLWGETTDALFEPEPAALLQDKAARIAESLHMGISFHKDPEAALRRTFQAEPARGWSPPD